MSSVIIDLASYELTQDEIELLAHPLCAGVILFTRNFYDVAQLQALIRDVRKKVKKPLLITVDQEGGRVQRFRQGLTQLPAMQAFATLAQDRATAALYAKEAGWLMAAEMTALGIDLSFAPVLDLGHECQAIGDRSFGCDVQLTTELAEAFIDGMHEVGMAATGKHFPGHGYVLADSHLETPYDDRPKDVIFAQDIKPFATLIARRKLDAIMPAHVIYTQCDNQPASGSPYWLKDVLRQQLGFDGAIFSDDLGMKGAGFMGNFVERAQRALQAGCDLLLLCNERKGVEMVFDQLQHSPTQAAKVRLHSLYQRQAFSLHELQQTQRWRNSQRTLDALQQQWLARHG
ncbi:beta-N-acetylhexosaminidase [Pasteurellaceae bacterium HPA106]|uniref:beta-N-acetylhexosaminidase n=1 Tax=Spirabiliibacterium pneumoniae TaxID=221400 RepID=UPI001AAD701D|nr:beta-N-acetylhexosaminidase [Spirabiliibacterium pneumoniae]MBE2895379.1 beta-N-acetylhexosaminidase [Spirabiliibacterium pneumoniae]